MRYIYPQMSRDYSHNDKKQDRNAMIRFGKTLKELLDSDYDKLNTEEQEFVDDYKATLPLGRNRCVMNQICYLFEDKFDSAVNRRLEEDFDYTVLKSESEDAGYSDYEYYSVSKIYEEYKTKIKNYTVHLQYEREDKYDVKSKINQINSEFLEECSKICPNENALCNIVLDLTYNTSSGKMFAWAMCGDIIVRNLLEKFDHKISFPVLNDDGDIYYCGNNFELLTLVLEG